MAKHLSATRSKTTPAMDANHYFKVLSAAERQPVARTQPMVNEEGKIDIEQELARRERIKNEDAEQDIALRRTTLNRLFVFLGIETGLIFLLTFFQGIQWPFGFHLEEWSFKVLTTVTIGQITAMLFAAVNYLFPKQK